MSTPGAGPSRAPILEARGLVKQYKRVRAVDGVDLTVGSGERVALLGPNGAGKTTTLMMLLGVITPDEGTVVVEGHTLRDEIVAGGRPSVDTIIATAKDLASAMASAHAKGITHRDLKPENVMRTRDGRIKILDFGLARVEAGPDGIAASLTSQLPGGHGASAKQRRQPRDRSSRHRGAGGQRGADP